LAEDARKNFGGISNLRRHYKIQSIDMLPKKESWRGKQYTWGYLLTGVRSSKIVKGQVVPLLKGEPFRPPESDVNQKAWQEGGV
jgi:hypothetical protein